jgi:tetratricopeptide (TPR) repeat protein
MTIHVVRHGLVTPWIAARTGALNNLFLALQQVRRFDEAITACQHGATINRETGDQHSEGGALNNLGLALQQVNRLDDAISACQDAAAIFRQTGDRHSEGIALLNLEVGPPSRAAGLRRPKRRGRTLQMCWS